MSAITTRVPIYEGLLALATSSERADIVAGGPQEQLDNGRWQGVPEAERAYAAINAVLARIAKCTDLVMTGIYDGQLPVRREILDPTCYVGTRLLWERPGGGEGILFLDNRSTRIRIDHIMIEPAAATAPSPTPIPTMAPPATLQKGERVNDNERLRRMQELMDIGMLPTTAAKRVAADVPLTSFEADVKRLMRKFKKRSSKL